MQLTVNENELRAADEVADEENKNVIKSIVDPAPGVVVDDEIDFKDIDFLPETIDYPSKTKVEEDKIEVDMLEDYANISKSLNTIVI